MLQTPPPAQPLINVITETADRSETQNLSDARSQLPPTPPVTLLGTNDSLSAFSYQELRSTDAEIRHLRIIRQERDGLTAADQVIPLHPADYDRVIGIFDLCQQESIDTAGADREQHRRGVTSERERAIFEKLATFVSCLTTIAKTRERANVSDAMTADHIGIFMAHSDAALFYRTKN